MNEAVVVMAATTGGDAKGGEMQANSQTGTRHQYTTPATSGRTESKDRQRVIADADCREPLRQEKVRVQKAKHRTTEEQILLEDAVNRKHTTKESAKYFGTRFKMQQCEQCAAAAAVTAATVAGVEEERKKNQGVQ